jgi:Dolichyl-phosphate-mannose-protein mannosyltransferase
MPKPPQVRPPAGALLTFAGLCLLGLIFLSLLAPGGRSPLKITGVDPAAYYGTAHSLLVDGDFDLRNQYEQLRPLRNIWNADVPATGKPGAPFPLGFSLLELPFLATGMAIEHLTQGKVTGYGQPSVIAWYVGIVVMLGVGLQCQGALLTRFANLWRSQAADPAAVSVGHLQWAIAGISVLLWAGTTLGFYTYSPMAHVAAFMASSLMWCAWLRALDRPSTARWLQFGAAAGLMFLCRWQDALLLLAPILVEVFALAKVPARLRQADYLLPRLWAILAFACVAAPQTLQWREVYGTWLTIPQGSGFISFPPAHLGQVLFSSQHGWFSWTPLALLGCLGLLSWLRRQALDALPFLVAMSAQITLIACVSTWHGDLFGMRYLTSLTPLLGLGLLHLHVHAGPVSRQFHTALACACVAFTLAFAMQYRLDLIPGNAPLTAQEYWQDKFALTSPMARKRAAQEARKLLDQGQAAPALTVCEHAAQRHGDNLKLIDLSEEALRMLPAPQPGQWAALEARRQAWRQQLLY